MKFLEVATLFALIVAASAQYENGFVKILEDQRYHDGASFGNYRNQEDGIKYKEETDPNGVRRGSWEYPDVNGEIRRVEFIAGSGIGFRIVSSNLVDPTPIARSSVQPAPVRAPQPLSPAPAAPRPATQQLNIPAGFPYNIPATLPAAALAKQPEPVNIFDYPANLNFFRDNHGHRFTFTAV